MSKHTYFAVVGKNKDLSLYELKALWATFLNFSDHIQQFTMSDEDYARFENVNGWIIKWWRVVNHKELPEILEGVRIVGVSSHKLWRTAKDLWVRRFKEIELQRTDLEIKRKGKELVNVEGEVGVVTGYQRIDRFEIIDFERPVLGMQIGIMPSKLAQTMVWIGVWLMKEKKWIWDPFCGFGTTGFVANSLGYDTLCSDINPTPTKQNLERWASTSIAHNDNRITVFKHDVTKPFTQPFLRYAWVVVTEGWLGPVLSQKAINQLTRPQLSERQEKIHDIYAGFLTNLHAVDPKLCVVITYPQWTFLDENMAHRFINHAKELWYTVEQAGDVYKRKKQFVGRRVLVIQPS